MVRRSSSAAVSVRSFFGHSDDRALCGGTMPDSSTLTSGYGSVLITGYSPRSHNQPNHDLSVHFDIRGLDDRRPAGDFAVDTSPKLRRAVTDWLHQLGRKLFADRVRPDCFYHFALNLRNDALRR